jgi:hypothetical protein
LRFRHGFVLAAVMATDDPAGVAAAVTVWRFPIS